jgi:triosephosphate isomerase
MIGRGLGRSKASGPTPSLIAKVREMRQLIAGNWKMNGLVRSLDGIRAVRDALLATPRPADVLICPPATLIAGAVEAAQGAFSIGAQDCHAEAAGAFTGDLSAEMLKDAGAVAVIVGHSERRQLHGETSAQIAAKASAARRAGLLAIVCVGETETDRQGGSAQQVCFDQLTQSVPDGAASDNTVIAYEPVWAIGTGRTPTAPEIEEMHRHVRDCLVRRFGADAGAIRILYGGSVKPANASKILCLDCVDGALVGGASLKASDFLTIISAVTRH